jgi:biotin carboxyl carrier protein
MIYKIKINQKTYEVEIDDLRARPIIAIVDGTPIEVWPEETTASVSNHPVIASEMIPAGQAQPLGAVVPTGGSVDTSVVRAPIPGNIISISVKSGDSVDLGQELCVLEAMKMRNAIRSSRQGTIASIRVNPGDTVNYNDILMEYAN